jgi:integrase
VSQDKSTSKAQALHQRKARSKFSKTDLRYWKDAVFKPAYYRDGGRHEADFWAVQITHSNQRVRWSLHTDNREAAAARAREIYQYVVANGWAVARNRFRPEREPAKNETWTVGEYLEAATKVSRAKPQTTEGYAKAFRRIVADVQKVGGGKTKFDYRSGGTLEWRRRVHAVRLGTITATKIEGWKREFVSRIKDNAVLRRRATASANSFLRRARALFSDRIRAAILKELGIEPPVSPFVEVELVREPSHKHFSTVNVEELICTAGLELAEADPEAFKVFLLAIFAGLRRREIDLLEWSAFDWQRNLLRIQPTAYFTAKTHESETELPLDAELAAVFGSLRERATSSFVIEASREPKHEAQYQYYRCNAVFERVLTWLRAHGLRSPKPLHELRKEFGSLINERYGIHAASRALRHSDIRVTSNHYTDSRSRVTTGMGHLLPNNLTAKDCFARNG